MMRNSLARLTPARSATLALLTSAAVLLVACGNSDDTNPNTATGGGGTTSGGSCTPPADECALLSDSEAATALGVSSTVTTMPGTMGPGDTSIDEPATGQCSWTEPTGPDVLSVVYICGAADNVTVSAEIDALKEQIGAGEAVAVTGVGTEAAWVLTSSTTGSSALEPDGGSYSGGLLTVVTGGGYVVITLAGNGTGSELQARATAAAGLVVSRL